MSAEPEPAGWPVRRAGEESGELGDDSAWTFTLKKLMARAHVAVRRRPGPFASALVGCLNLL